MKKYTGILYVLAAGVLWGTLGAFVKYFSSRGFGSVETALIRVGTAALSITVYLLIKDKSLLKIRPCDIWCFLGSGLCSLLFFTLCYFEAIIQSSMSTAAVLLYLAPIFVMLMSRLIFKDRITPVKLLAIVFSVGGCALVSGIVGNAVGISLKAVIFGIGSAFGYALYSIFSKLALRRGYASLTITAYTFIFAFLGLLFFADLGFVAKNIFVEPITPVMALLIGAVSSMLPFLFYTKGLETVEAGKASVIASVEPVCATLIGVVLFHESLTFTQALGVISVIFSVILLEMNPVKKKN